MRQINSDLLSRFQAGEQEMQSPPPQLDGADVHGFIILTEKHQEREVVLPEAAQKWLAEIRESLPPNSEPAEPVVALAICSYAKTQNQFYLFSCTENWEVVGDDVESSIEEIMGQLDFQYEGMTPDQWQWIKPVL